MYVTNKTLRGEKEAYEIKIVLILLGYLVVVLLLCRNKFTLP